MTQTAEDFAAAGYEITMLNDRHAYLKCPSDSPLRPGDLPTFDKWDAL